MSPPPAFGTYRVLHQIGSGVLGPVFRAYDSQQDRLVAIKTVKLDLVPETAAAVAERLRALAEVPVPHPAMAGAVEAGLEGSTPFIALEFLSGDTLDVMLRQSGPFAPKRALPILHVIAEAVDAAAAAGLDHGALHPRDVFVDLHDRDVRVNGFGIARALDACNVRVAVRRPYSAPERVNGQPWDSRADLFSLGVMAYEMLSGERPMGSDSADGDEARLAADLSPEARAAVRRVLATAMSESPADRYESARSFVDALASATVAEAQIDVPTLPLPAPAVSEVEPPAVSEVEPPAVALVEPMAAVVVPEAAPVVVSELAVEDLAAEAATLPSEPETQSRSLRLTAARPAFADRPLSFGQPVAPVREFEEPRHAPGTALTWAAGVALLAAGLVVGGVSGYQYGVSRGQAAQTPAAATPTPSPVVANSTEVIPTTATPTSSPTTETAAAPTTPAPAGRLMIQSVPPGARVVLDGVRVGETPLRLTTPLGRHEIQIARSGYVPRTEHVELTERVTSRTVNARLVRGTAAPTPASGSVDFDSRPRGAKVTVDGRSVGVTPIRVPELAAGNHRVQIDLAGHKPVTSTITVVGGETTQLKVTLEQRGLVMETVPRMVR